MVQIKIDYLGDLHCKIQHGPSKQEFFTDAPLDNNGKAEFISPTDLLGASVGSCIATIMGIKAKNSNINIDGLKITVLKEMQNEPYRRVKTLFIDFVFPQQLDEKSFTIMKNVIKTCPVTRSLHPDIEIVDTYSFANN